MSAGLKRASEIGELIFHLLDQAGTVENIKLLRQGARTQRDGAHKALQQRKFRGQVRNRNDAKVFILEQ